MLGPLENGPIEKKRTQGPKVLLTGLTALRYVSCHMKDNVKVIN